MLTALYLLVNVHIPKIYRLPALTVKRKCKKAEQVEANAN